MAGVVALWSFIPVLAKIVMRTFDPFTLAFLRLSQGTLVCALLYVLRGGTLRALLRMDKWIAVGMAGLSVNYIFFALSLSLTSASAGTLIVQSQIVILAVLASVFLKESLPPWKLGGMAAVLCGVMLVVATRGDIDKMLDPNASTGNILMIVAAAGWAVYALSNRALMNRRSSLEILVPIMGLSAILTGLIAATRFQLHAPIVFPTVAAVVVLGSLSTGISFYLLSEGFKRLSAALGGMVTSLTPLSSMLLAGWILHERLGWQVLGAAALIVSGILCSAFAERKAPPSEQGVLRRGR